MYQCRNNIDASMFIRDWFDIKTWPWFNDRHVKFISTIDRHRSIDLVSTLLNWINLMMIRHWNSILFQCCWFEVISILIRHWYVDLVSMLLNWGSFNIDTTLKSRPCFDVVCLRLSQYRFDIEMSILFRCCWIEVVSILIRH